MAGSRTNTEWIEALTSSGESLEAALTDLRAILMRGLPYALSKWLSPGDPQFEILAENVVQETLLRAIDRLDTFEGRSQFTTWVQKIAVRLALSELRRKRWQDVSLDDLVESGAGLESHALMADPGPGPEISVERSDLQEFIGRMIAEELTDRQRTALEAVAIRGMPLSEVARRMDTNRNALYKLLHDARLRLKRRLIREGLSPEDVLASFEPGKN